jgi:glycosyltransferase involved in cell wall biosynthesis
MFPTVRMGAYIDYYTPTTISFFRLYDFVICNTKRHYDVFKSHPQSLYIPWGTDVEMYKPIEKDEKVNQVVFFHSCGLNHIRKGTDLLVEAFELVKGAALLIIHSQMVIPDETLRDRILHNPKIYLIEKTIGAPGLYSKGDVYVYPSRLDGIGLTIAEALSSGLPVITTDDAPMNEFVQHGNNGRLVKVARQFLREYNYYWPLSECDVKSLAKEMQYYVDKIYDLRHYQQVAREYALMNLNWNKNSQFLQDWLEKTSCTRSKLNLVDTMKIIRYDFYLDWGSVNNFIRFYIEKFRPGRILTRLKKVLRISGQ